MSAVLGISGILGFLGCLIGLIVSAIRKHPKKPSLIGMGVCFVMFIVGVSLPSDKASTTPTQAKTSISSTVGKSAKGKQASSATPESKVTDGATTVDYKLLYKDYGDNPISADKKYKDKKLILTGTIANIDRDIAQSPYITFNVDEYGAKSIKMSFNDDDTVASLKKGQTVTVVGTCGGTFASTIVMLNDCSTVK